MHPVTERIGEAIRESGYEKVSRVVVTYHDKDLFGEVVRPPIINLAVVSLYEPLATLKVNIFQMKPEDIPIAPRELLSSVSAEAGEAYGISVRTFYNQDLIQVLLDRRYLP